MSLRTKNDGIRGWISANARHLSSTSGLALAAMLFVGQPDTADAACLINGTTSSNTGTTGPDTVLCDTANDPGGAPITTFHGDDTIDVVGGVTVGTITTGLVRHVDADRVTITGATVNGGINTWAGNDTIAVSGGTVTGLINSYFSNDTITITNGSVVSDINAGWHNDRVTVDDSTVNGTLNAHNGDDVVILTRSTVTGNVIGGNHRDNIRITDSTVNGSVFLAASANGGGAIHRSTLTINGNSLIQGDVAGTNFFRAGDSFNLNGGTINGTISGFAGNDSFTWTAGDLQGQFLGGTENDTVTIGLTTGNVDTIIDGEAGTDSFRVINADTTVEAATVRGFETVHSGNSVVTFDSLMLNGVNAPGDNNLATVLTVTGGDVTLGGASVLTDLLGSRSAETLTVTGSTVVSGAIEGAGGSDTISVLGDASVLGDVLGGGAGHNGGADSGDTITIATTGSVGNVLSGDGNDVFTWTSGAITGFVGGDGSDIATVTAAQYDGTQVLDGGDDAAVGDGQVDVLTLGGFSGTLNGGNIVNWEVLNLANAAITINDLVSAQLNVCGGSTTVGGASMVGDVDGCINDDVIVITGDTVIANDIEGAGGSDAITISGNASVGGVIRGDGAGQDMSNASDTGDTITLNTTGTVGMIDAGAGADTVDLFSGTVTTDVFGGIDNDMINLDGASVAGVIDGGDGVDRIDLISGSADSATGADGDDVMTLNGATIASVLAGGRGVDLISVIAGSVGTDIHLGNTINSSSDADTLIMTGGTVTGTVYGDRGQDTITLTGGTIGVDVLSNPGDDIITVDGTVIQGQIDAGRGNDDIMLLSGTVNEVTGGNDDDTIVLNGATITTDLRGGEGQDVITVISGTVGGDISLGRGNNNTTNGDTLLLMTGGDVAGNIYGDRGNDAITMTGGTVALEVRANLGDDTITLDGGAISGEVFGGDGNDVFTWTSGSTAGFDGEDGSDIATVTAAAYDGTQVLDGGDDASSADGYVDALTLQGLNITTTSSSVLNWEAVSVLDGTVDFGSDLIVGSGTGLGLIAGSNGIISGSGDFSLTGDLETLAGGTFNHRSGVASLITVVGSVRNAGAIDTQDGITGDSIAVSGDYSGGGALWLDVNATGDTADTLLISGDVVAGGTTIFVQDITPSQATGNDILLIDVQGATSTGDFQLAGGTVTLGNIVYELNLVGSQWLLQFLELALSPSNVVYEVYPQNLHALNKLQGHHRRVQGRTWLAGSDPLCDTAREASTESDPLCRDAGFWMKASGAVSDLDPEFSTTERDFGTSDIDYDMRSTRVELGFETLLGEYDNGKLAGGVWAFHGSASLSGSSSVANGNVDTDATGVGASLTWYEDSGFYADAQLQYAEFKSGLSSDRTRLVTDNKGSGYAASLEIGKTFALSPSVSLTPELQYLHYEVDFDQFTGAGGEQVYLEDGSTSELRLGGTLEYRTGTIGAMNNRLYATANVFRMIDATTVVNSAGSPLTNEIRPWRGEIGFGGSHEWVGASGSRSAIYGEVAASSEFGSGWSSGNTLSGSVGFKIEF